MKTIFLFMCILFGVLNFSCERFSWECKCTIEKDGSVTIKKLNGELKRDQAREECMDTGFTQADSTKVNWEIR